MVPASSGPASDDPASDNPASDDPASDDPASGGLAGWAPDGKLVKWAAVSNTGSRDPAKATCRRAVPEGRERPQV